MDKRKSEKIAMFCMRVSCRYYRSLGSKHSSLSLPFNLHRMFHLSFGPLYRICNSLTSRGTSIDACNVKKEIAEKIANTNSPTQTRYRRQTEKKRRKTNTENITNECIIIIITSVWAFEINTEFVLGKFLLQNFGCLHFISFRQIISDDSLSFDRVLTYTKHLWFNWMFC